MYERILTFSTGITAIRLRSNNFAEPSVSRNLYAAFALDLVRANAQAGLIVIQRFPQEQDFSDNSPEEALAWYLS